MLSFIGKLWTSTLRLKKISDYCNLYFLNKHFSRLSNCNTTIVRYIIGLRTMSLKKIKLNMPSFLLFSFLLFSFLLFSFLLFSFLFLI